MSQPGFAFQRVAIVNRGEPAMRFINAVREWNAEGRTALRIIAVYTAADRHATFVREADEAVLIGPADADAAFAGSPYLDYAELERALRACRADAVWPGWGFVSEKAEFAELCFPRPAPTSDPADRDISGSPHAGTDFSVLGEIFDPANNPERKKPFDMRSLLRGVIDADHEPLERWADMADAESAVVFDAHLGGQPVEIIGFESRPLPRHGFFPVDGPSQWTAGTLFPLSSKKTARAINAASGNRPLVILANLSGFDGSPESLRRLQLEYGAEIGRAVVNFDGPIVFCVVSRYHGGAFVVFSGTLNDNMEVAAVEGSYASVIGGAPAAAVVFAAEVRKRTAADHRVADLQAAIAEATASGADDKASALRAKLGSVWPAVHAEKLGQLADEFDGVHSIKRASQVGSVQAIVPAARLRPYLIDAVRRGMQCTPAAGTNPDPG